MRLQVFKIQKGNTIKIFALDQDYVLCLGNWNSIKAENRYLPGLTIQCDCVVCRSKRQLIPA